MSSYTGSANRPDRAKAIVAVVAVHVALAAVILTGLNGRVIRAAVETLKTFDVTIPPPPPPPPPLPPTRQSKMKKPEGAPAKKAETTPIVAPPARIPLPSPIPAAKIAGTGSAPTSGAGVSGNGTGAGGNGNGPGGGDYSKFTPAHLVRNLSRGDYQRLAAGRLPAGRAMLALRVEPSGLATNCRVVRSSGDSVVDGGLCPLVVSRLRFRPALNAEGRPIPYSLQYVATWQL